MKNLTMIGMFVLVFVLGYSAQAACGGGGYSPAPKNSSSSVSVSATSTSNASSTTATTTPSASSKNPSVVFDASRFHAMSGQLNLTYEQATGVINAINDMRKMIDTTTLPKEFDAKKEFEKRLSKILNEKQLKTYQSAS